MPRISNWKGGVHSNDFKFLDRIISEQFTVGGTGILLHKYLGPNTDSNDGSDASKPAYSTQSEKNIQDLLFLENRDRKYDENVYTMRGIYQRSDRDFDLSQFGLFISNDILFMTFHLSDMVALLGRKIMAGDVIELQHLKDFYVDETIPAALKRYYVAGDCSFATEGFSQTWFPHLWRVKFSPLVDSQEYKSIVNSVNNTAGAGASTLSAYLNINEAIVEQAENDVPLSGYDVSKIFVKPTPEEGGLSGQEVIYADNMNHRADEIGTTAAEAGFTPSKDVQGYLTGDGLAPNGLEVGTGIAFPLSPNFGEYFLRLDYMPNRLFRFDGRRWVKVEDNVRANLNPGVAQTQLDTFINNSATYVDVNGNVRDSRQSLSKGLGITPDK